MCFSAEASFLAAGLTGAIGTYAFVRVSNRALVPLAFVPVVFSLQQAIEGAVWVGLETGSSPLLLGVLSKAFLIIGEALWPLLIPFAVLAAEPNPDRRKILKPLALAGAVVCILFTMLISAAVYTPQIQNGCIAYQGTINWAIDAPFYPFASAAGWRLSSLDWTVIPYASITLGSLFLSSHRTVQVFGLFTAFGLSISLFLYRETLVSVWCFFAAIASLIVVVAIEQARQRSLDCAQSSISAR